jgi:SWI/SNF-related matrix-associated actin-dependent regulator 1 of chromatin subfamily A
LETLKYLTEINQWPVVIVCKAGLKKHWQNECWQHFKLPSTILSGSIPIGASAFKKDRILIVNWDILDPWLPFLRSIEPKAVAGDEIHAIGNMNTRRCRAFRILCKGVKIVIGISGTPLTNRPFELYPILHILDPEQFDSPFTFGMNFCDGENNRGRWQFSGARNLKTLNVMLKKSCLIRRLKEDVLAELPPLQRFVIPLEITDRAQYDRAENDIVAWLAETDLAAAQRAARAERYTRFSYLKRLAAWLMFDSLTEWIDSFLEESDGKLFMGTIHTQMILALHEKYKDLATFINGSLSMNKRQEAEDYFRKDPKCRVLFGQIKAAGEGLNLPECQTPALAELPWTPGACNQFIGRCHRMTSTLPVNAYFLIPANTIVSDLCKIIQRKQKITDQTLDGVDVRQSSLTLWDELGLAMKKRQTKEKSK